MNTLARGCAAALVLFAGAALAEEVPESVKKLVPTLQGWGSDPALVAAVKAQNASGLTLAQIQEKDKAWMATQGVDPFMQSLMENAAAKALQRLEQSAPYYVELFLMDAQGANVAMTNKTSDYWQGDEPKFTASYAGGKGAVHMGDVKFDESTQAYLVQVSVPVLDGGAAIGALTVGINLDAIK